MSIALTDYPGHLVACGGLLLLLAIVVQAYRRQEFRNAGLRSWAFGFLSFIPVAVVWILLWNPSHSVYSDRTVPNKVLAFFDTSRSMSISDREDRPRLDEAMEVFRKRFDPENPETPSFSLYGFDEEVYECDSMQTLRRWGSRTDLRSAIGLLRNEIVRSASAENPLEGDVVGAVFFTDGQAEEKIAAAYPLLPDSGAHTIWVGVGSKKPPSDVAVLAVSAPRKVQVNDVYRVDATVAREGVAPASTSVSLLRDGNTIGVERVIWPEDSKIETVTFSVGAGKLGADTLTVRVGKWPGEADISNNVRRVTVQVVEEPRLKVLFHSKVLCFDTGKVRQALARDKKIDLDLGLDVVNAAGLPHSEEPLPGQVALPRTKEDFFKYDVIVTEPITIESLTTDQAIGIYSFVVERGGGLLLLPGRTGFVQGWWDNEKIRSLLPVETGVGLMTQSSIQKGPPELTREGLQSRILSATDFVGFSAVASTYYSELRKKPAATILASLGGEPLACVHRVGRGQVCLLNTSRLFDWYREDSDGGLLRGYLSGLTTCMGRVPGTESGVDLFATRSVQSPGEIVFEASIRDSDLNPVENATVLLETGNDLFRMSPAGGGRYHVAVEGVTEESVVASAQAELNGTFLGERVLTATLPLPRGEMDQVYLDEGFLQDLSARLGGEYRYVDDLDEKTAKSFAATKEIRALSRMESAWTRWWLFLALLAWMSGNWLLRRTLGYA